MEPSKESDEAFFEQGGDAIKNIREFQIARVWFRAGYDLARSEAARTAAEPATEVKA